MIKKLVLYVVVIFFIACGSNHNVIRTSNTNATSKTARKTVLNKSTRITVKKPVPVVKPVETKKVLNSKSSNEAVVKSEENNAKIFFNKEKSINEIEQNDSQIEILEATTRVKVTTEMVLKYIEEYKEIAEVDMKRYGIPASIILGQGILESGAGTGPLSIKANNHFGIKCHKEWTGPSVKYNDDVENECFRKYKDPSESYRDHSLFLTTRAHYSSLFQLDKTDYKSWAKGLKNAGYATDPAYPTKLIAIIERYHLQKFDFDVLGADYVASNNPMEVNSNNEISTENLNSSRHHQVEKGDTLYSISRKYNVTIQDLKKLNTIFNDTLSVGQSLLIH
jgi:flagellum-specific peptidoglycan hydrolase FlgJ